MKSEKPRCSSPRRTQALLREPSCSWTEDPRRSKGMEERPFRAASATARIRWPSGPALKRQGLKAESCSLLLPVDLVAPHKGETYSELSLIHREIAVTIFRGARRVDWAVSQLCMPLMASVRP